MNNLSPLAQVCVTLIESDRLTKDEIPPIIKEEVLTFYKNKEKEGEDVDV